MRLPFFWILAWFLPAFFVFAFSQNSLFSLDHELSRTLVSPSFYHPFGFDCFGRDLLLLSLKASGASLCFGLISMVFSSLVSLVAGVGLALSPLPLRFLGQRFLELLLAFPSLLLALSWAAVSGPGWDTLLISLSLGTFPSFTRLVFVRTIELRSEEFVIASGALGASSVWIAKAHFLPSLLSLCSVKLPGLFAHAILAEATLSFLGVGAPIGSDTWGSLLAQGREYLVEAPHLTIATGVPLVLTVLSLQVLSERKTDLFLRR